MSVKEILEARAIIVNDYIEAQYKKKEPVTADSLWESMFYSLRLPGKRLRPVLLLEGARLAGIDQNDALPFAFAYEAVHTASLIHDDLPCMDNDDFRRGKPTNHKVFGEAKAVLAADCLLVWAFELMLANDSPVPLTNRARSAAALARATGAVGICSGQVYDLYPDGRDYEAILRTDQQKTAMLIEGALLSGALLGNPSDDLLHGLSDWGKSIGVAFQIADDILDKVGDPTQLGKATGKDEEQGKTTYVSLLGLEGARAELEKYTAKGIAAIKNLEGTEFLRDLALWLRDRTK